MSAGGRHLAGHGRSDRVPGPAATGGAGGADPARPRRRRQRGDRRGTAGGRPRHHRRRNGRRARHRARHRTRSHRGGGADPADDSLSQPVQLAAAGALDVPVWRAYPLDRAAAAHGDIEARRNRGKVVLLPWGPFA
ncbi:zinc-binding dehydrogenase [Streptomyces lydicus]|uniref:zinc-binding dehydrogenase n=1 Tax=Streptomyces lydicus TaxID=47763 RepID=UPI00379A4868